MTKPKNLLGEYERLKCKWEESTLGPPDSNGTRYGRGFTDEEREAGIRTLAYLEYIAECREKGLLPQ